MIMMMMMMMMMMMLVVVVVKVPSNHCAMRGRHAMDLAYTQSTVQAACLPCSPMDCQRVAEKLHDRLCVAHVCIKSASTSTCHNTAVTPTRCRL
jgi:hypothetical protein